MSKLARHNLRGVHQPDPLGQLPQQTSVRERGGVINLNCLLVSRRGRNFLQLYFSKIQVIFRSRENVDVVKTKLSQLLKFNEVTLELTQKSLFFSEEMKASRKTEENPRRSYAGRHLQQHLPLQLYCDQTMSMIIPTRCVYFTFPFIE